MYRDTRPGQFFMPALALQMFFDETVPAWQSSHLQGRTFYNGYLLYFINDEIVLSRLPAHKIYKDSYQPDNLLPSIGTFKKQIWTKRERLRTFYNTDGLINCLRQPWQIRNAWESL